MYNLFSLFAETLKSLDSQTLAVLILLFFAALVMQDASKKKNKKGSSSFYDWSQLFISPFAQAKKATLAEIDAMSGVEFEKCVGNMFARQGYDVEYTRASTDFGVDIILIKDRIRTAVQTKRYRKPLSQAPVREVVAGMMHYKCSKAIVVTNSTFTASAQELAKSNYCKLIDREKIAQMLVAES